MQHRCCLPRKRGALGPGPGCYPAEMAGAPGANWGRSCALSVPGETVKEVEVLPAPLGTSVPAPGSSCHSPVAEEEVSMLTPAPGLLHITERRQPLSSVSSLEVHFDLLDLTELTDMSDQELAEVFADSDDESSELPAGLQPLPRATCLHSPSWTRTRGEQRCEQLLNDPEQQPAMVDTLLTMEKPQD